VLLLTGAVLVSYLCHPKAWILGPLGAVRRAWSVAEQESGWNPDAAGDNGGSVGLLQFSNDKADWYGGDWRRSALLSGWAWGRYVSLFEWAWIVRFAVPVYGYAYMRYAWTHGAAGDPPELATVLEQVKSERSPGAYVGILLLTAPLSTLLVLGLIKIWKRVRR